MTYTDFLTNLLGRGTPRVFAAAAAVANRCASATRGLDFADSEILRLVSSL